MPVALVLSLALAAAAPPWDAPPFSADPKAVARAAAALHRPEGEGDLDVLLEEGSWVFDEEGRATATLRLVYRPLTREAAESWGRVRRDWAPWHQARPEIRARVILPSGEVRTLDPATLVEAGADDDEDDDVFTDRRSLRGPLPALDAGVVVEEVSTLRDLAPGFAAGSGWRFFFAWGPPTRLARLRIEAPAGLPLHHVSRGLALAPREQVKGGRRVLVWERRPSPPAPKREGWLPPDDSASPQVAFSTGRTWGDVAAAYGDLVEKRLEGGLPAAMKAAVVAGDPPERAAQRALDWISSRVRYTGLELGEAAIVPALPAESLARGYGDCKDLSLLLVAALRAGGHPATLALVRSRWDELSPTLPGIGEFDHAIVYVGGARPFFVDATDPDVPVGELPLTVQGRRALVAARGEKGLTVTPEAGPDRNRLAIVREVLLGEQGPARATDVRECRGAAALDVRHDRRGVAPEKLREWDEREARRVLNTEGKVTTAAAGLDPLDGPVTVRLAAEGSRWAMTREDEANAVVSPDPLFEQLPERFRPDPPEQGETPAKLEPRKAPMVLPVAYAATLDYRLTPPPGFRAAEPLPGDRTEKWGPATFTARHAVTPAGILTVSYGFSLPTRRLTPKEADALAAAVGAFTTLDGPRVRFERTAAVLLGQGKGREALAELQRRVAMEPAKVRHRIHLALALLELGLGDAARVEARRAVALAPGDGWPHRALAWVLQHDALGRVHAPGFDLAGAIAAERRALEIEKSASTRITLAKLLALGTDGVRFGPGARLEEAASQLQAAREAGDASAAAEELEVALRAGRFEQAAALARASKELAGREAAIVAAVAMKGGSKAALAEATRLAPQQRAQVMSQAYLHLLRVRRYPLALAVLEEVTGPESRGVLEPIRKLRPHEELKVDQADAKLLPVRLVLALLSGEDEALAPLVSARAKWFARSDLVKGLRIGFRIARDQVNLPRDVMADSTLVSMSTEVDCVPKAACRLVATTPTNGGRFELVAVWERDAWRLLSGDAGTPADLGAVARARLDAGDVASARKLLGWARELAGKPDPDGFLASGALERLAPAGKEHADAALRLAALALEAHSALPEPALRPLAAAKAGAAPEARRAIQWALADGHATLDRHREALAVAEEILAETPDAEPAILLRAESLARLGRKAEARGVLEVWLRSTPDDLWSARFLAHLAAADGDFALQRRTLAPFVASGKAGSQDYNELAWGALFAEPLAATALEEARRSVDLAKDGGDRELHTLATVLAASGQPAEAVQVLRKALEARGGAPEPYDWLVVGQVAELYGALDAATAAYRRVEPTDKGSRMDSHHLAQARLRRLAR